MASGNPFTVRAMPPASYSSSHGVTVDVSRRQPQSPRSLSGEHGRVAAHASPHLVAPRVEFQPPPPVIDDPPVDRSLALIDSMSKGIASRGAHERDCRVVLDPVRVTDRMGKVRDAAEEQFKKEPTWFKRPPPALSLRPAILRIVEGISLETHGDTAVAYTQGRRKTMEDAYYVGARGDIHIGALYDGHAGEFAATYAAEHFADSILKTLESRPAPGTPYHATFIWNVLTLAPVHFSQYIPIPIDREGRPSALGTTAVVAVEVDGALWIANIGDSRAILVNPATRKRIPLTDDAKPDDPKYAKGVTNRGGLVADHRVGPLSLARSLGDRAIPGMSARARVMCVPVEGHREWLLVQHCDGVTEGMTEQAVVKLIGDSYALPGGRDCGAVAINLARAALETGSEDNISVMVRQLGARPTVDFRFVHRAPSAARAARVSV